MEIISHRRNSIEELKRTSPLHGVEVDIRSDGEDLIISHDPFRSGVGFSSWLGHYKHGTLIVNVKEEGLEQRVIRLLELHGVTNFFFLDQSFPFLLRWARRGERRCAVRVSEFESIETALSVSHLVDWVWLDMFTPVLPNVNIIRGLKSAGLKVCLVSPELQSHSQSEIELLRPRFSELRREIDAVCTKFPEWWGG